MQSYTSSLFRQAPCTTLSWKSCVTFGRARFGNSRFLSFRYGCGYNATGTGCRRGTTLAFSSGRTKSPTGTFSGCFTTFSRGQARYGVGRIGLTAAFTNGSCSWGLLFARVFGMTCLIRCCCSKRFGCCRTTAFYGGGASYGICSRRATCSRGFRILSLTRCRRRTNGNGRR